jgi:hypothetical protein
MLADPLWYDLQRRQKPYQPGAYHKVHKAEHLVLVLQY